MRRRSCKICGFQSRPGAIGTYHVVPLEVTEQARMPESETIELCSDCHQELYTWYKANVTPVAYDPAAKWFMGKSGVDIVKAYRLAFNSFVRYKNEQRRS